MEGDARFTDIWSCPSISRHPQLIPRLGRKWLSKSKKLNLEHLRRNCKEHSGGDNKYLWVYLCQKVKPSCSPRKEGEGDLGEVTLCQEVTDPAPLWDSGGSSTFGASKAPFIGTITSIHLDKPPWLCSDKWYWWTQRVFVDKRRSLQHLGAAPRPRLGPEGCPGQAPPAPG